MRVLQNLIKPSFIWSDGMFRFDQQAKILPLAISSKMFANDSYLTGKMIVDQQIRFNFSKITLLYSSEIYLTLHLVFKKSLHSNFRNKSRF